MLHILSAFLALFVYPFIRLKLTRKRRLGFFHPYAAGGGGGERVLWMGVQACLNHYEGDLSDIEFVLYCNVSDKQRVLEKVRQRFGIHLQHDIKFVRLRSTFLLEAWMYPRFTLIGQSIGSMFVGLEAVLKYPSHVWVDTLGQAFTYPVVRLLCLSAAKIITYTHYPTISTDMLNKVKSRTADYNNQGVIARSQVLTNVKLLYYKV